MTRNMLTVPFFLTFCAALIFASQAHSATKYAAANGSSSNTGNSASSPWDSQSCFTRLSPGDTCFYLPGNYGNRSFEPTNNGSASNPIVHECQTLYGCSFSRARLTNVSYLTIRNIKVDAHYYDPTHAYTNPMAWVRASHHIVFDSVFIRGEPQRCADGNPGGDCTGTEYQRYNDLFVIGDPNGNSSNHIEIKGKTQLINSNHTVVTLYDDRDSTACEPNESNIWIHGTEEDPIIISILYHHSMAFFGACRVLVEHAEFQRSGSGRGDIQQPDASATDTQTGETIHGADFQHAIVRFSTMSFGGAATSGIQNSAHIGVGSYGTNLNTVDGACFAHLSHYRPWGPVVTMGRLNSVTNVNRFSVLNNAVSEAWYMNMMAPSLVGSSYAPNLLVRTGGSDNFSAYIDGLVGSSTFATNSLLYNAIGSNQSFAAVPFTVDGVRIGSNVARYESPLYVDAGNGDFTPRAASPLLGNASPIARTTNSGSGSIIAVDRPECFMGTMDGMRPGDIVDIGGDECRIIDVNLGNGAVTCSNAISWQSGEPVYYKVGGQLFTDIGARRSASAQNTITAPAPPGFLSVLTN